ncbi:Dorsal-ventral patterning protein Sog [Nymphon striatum]|nr:Dorsal-ventral patterning protein Sog [Nymphon striatum]
MFLAWRSPKNPQWLPPAKKRYRRNINVAECYDINIIGLIISECPFGNRTFEIEEKWSPDLGPPFGVMHCIRCSCVALRRFACVDIKDECPKPTCTEPVLPPGKCCKTCPGSVYTDLEDDIALSKSEMEISSHRTEKYIALLTGNSMNPKVPSRGSARGFFKFLKRDLHFSIYTNSIEKVTSIRFTDQEANIVKEYDVKQNSSAKICGIWHKLPRMYRRLLQKQRLSVQVTTADYKDGIASGRLIKRYHNGSGYARYIFYTKHFTFLSRIFCHLDFFEVLFESVLSPDTTFNTLSVGAGGLAAVKLEGSSAIISITFDGMFKKTDTKNPSSMTVFIEKVNGKDNSRVVIADTKKEVIIDKPSLGKHSISIALKFSAQELKQMARGKLALGLISNFGNKISGRIIPKQTCDVFQAVISGDGSNNGRKSKTGAAGFALLELEDSGTIRYSIKIESLSSTLVELKIKYPGKKRRRVKEVEDALATYMDGWANGTYTKTTVTDIEKLMNGEFFVNVGSENFPSEIQGKIRRSLRTQPQLQGNMVLLTGNKTSAAGVAWVYVDDECRLGYDVYSSGLSLKKSRHHHNDKNLAEERHILELFDVPKNREFKNKRIALHKFNGVHVNSIKKKINRVTLFGIHQGITYLKIVSKYYTSRKKDQEKPEPDLVMELKGNINSVRVPKHCLPNGNLMDQKFMNMHGYDTQAEQESNYINTDRDTHCIYRKKTYADGAQWKAIHRPCQICFCQKGEVKCQHYKCPPLDCIKQITLASDCCPICEEDLHLIKGPDSKIRGCTLPGENTFHIIGTKWYPFLPPKGFSKCVVCECNATTLKAKCTPKPCPTLYCPKNTAYREKPDSCCKKCPGKDGLANHNDSKVTETAADGAFNKEKGEISKASDRNEILSNGGCTMRTKIHKHGDLWNPIVASGGKVKEVCCYCKNGKLDCFRRNCSSNIAKNIKKMCAG